MTPPTFGGTDATQNLKSLGQFFETIFNSKFTMGIRGNCHFTDATTYLGAERTVAQNVKLTSQFMPNGTPPNTISGPEIKSGGGS